MQDSQNFDSFYLGSVRRITSYVHAMTGNLGEAEDIAQEAFAKAWQHWGKVSGYADPEAWVRTVAFRIQVSAWRKAKNRFRAQRQHGQPADQPELNPDYVAIVNALRKIPETQRRAITLHYILDLTVEEIAEETGVAIGTVKARLHRGRKTLSSHLTDSGRAVRGFGEEMHNHG
ncbi:RNA polymerase sigma-70 factor (ECF subfamily) [Catenulispora sp. GAS73]|uniref:SigE family RNA polymerase sigma factor n=1 Tax=Catenulispora sp. GAS73 TaxID=3156269 RepID=UPI0035171464